VKSLLGFPSVRVEPLVPHKPQLVSHLHQGHVPRMMFFITYLHCPTSPPDETTYTDHFPVLPPCRCMASDALFSDYMIRA